ncbi:hypothetical protein EPA93_00565 [Ktedonosporobacter rubrisoli]|uniref:Uncharacterized protein n=1 Tax=Ktedonosporobacter rubrisoli TaxID=2509675 RepID=A0A4P6JHZ2_KTERU|nr:hypothetical protein [Ktedonosporobacter rubrisoli]QBD74563.1 hypothetical protein EPA93_00565 [Ktedonosporobacter rubrisoli]
MLKQKYTTQSSKFSSGWRDHLAIAGMTLCLISILTLLVLVELSRVQSLLTKWLIIIIVIWLPAIAINILLLLSKSNSRQDKQSK